MATIVPQGEKLRQALKWISGQLQDDQHKRISCLVQEASLRFNLSPKEEIFLQNFYQDHKDDDPCPTE